MHLSEFAEEFFQSILDDLRAHGGNAEEIFVDRMCTFLADNGVIENVQPSFWQKQALGIKVNAYGYNEEQRKLTLFIAVHEMPYDKMRTISRADVERAFRRLAKFFEYSAEGGLQEFIEESNRDSHDLAHLIESVASELEELDLFVLTNGVFKSNDAIELELPGVQEVRFHVWDIERLHQLMNEMQGVDSFSLDFAEQFGETFEMMLVPGAAEKFDCYVGYIPGTLLAKAYGQLGQRLIERNVRSFLQARGNVNKGIRDTLQTRRDMFIAFNNGISTTAEDVQLTKVRDGLNLYRVDSVVGWQIVNGGQTTASLHQAWESGVDISGVYVQAKLTVLKTNEQEIADELISRISQYANTQNKISFSDLGANELFQTQLEQISRSVWAPDPMGRKSEMKWYYERARGQYLVDLNRQSTRAQKNKFKLQHPKQKSITKTQFAKYYMTWEQMPHVVSRGSEANFTEFMQYMQTKKPQVDTDFFKHAIARALLFTSCNDMVRRMALPGYKANVVAYTVAMLSHAAADRFPLAEIWNKQGLDASMQRLIADTVSVTWGYLSAPPTKGTNISQWCKKEECWKGFKSRYTEEVKQLARTSKALTLRS